MTELQWSTASLWNTASRMALWRRVCAKFHNASAGGSCIDAAERASSPRTLKSLFRIPKIDRTDRLCFFPKIARLRAVDLRYERWTVFFEERLDSAEGRDELMRKLGIGRLADHDQQSNSMPHDCFAFIDLVADALIVGDCNATFGAAVFQPLLVGTVQ